MPDHSTDPFAVVTGASSGIGLELARQFADHGFDVLVCAEDAGLAEAAADLRSSGASITEIRADLATYEGVERLVAAIAQAGRPVDAVALNAGVGNGGRFVDIALEDELRLIQVNVVSTVHVAKRVLPAMLSRGGGRVLITASVAGTMPGPFYATYAASKSFVLSFAEALRYELKESGVTVTALMPGPTDTNFFARADMLDTAAGEGKKDDPARVAADGFTALMAGKDHVVAGSVKNKVQVIGAGVLPDTAKAAVHAKLTEPQP
jgi:short-subunit dehydrogenase